MTSEGTRTREKIYIIGHKNPDTDSICSAIAYTELKKAVLERKLADGTFEAENPLQEGMPVPIPEYIACRAGIVNEETKYVLEYFDVEPPQYQDNVQPQIADMDLNLVPGIEGRASIKQAWELMQEEHAKSVPVLAEGKLKGIVTITDIAQSYMDKSDSSVLSRAGTRFASIAETLNGHIVCGGSDEVFEDGKVTIAASSPDVMEEVIEPSDLVIAGNRFETHFTAIELGARCLVMCQGATPTKTIKKLAEERGCIIINTPYDTFTAARLINQSMPVQFFMTGENLVTFQMGDAVEDIEYIMKTNRFHNFPVVEKCGNYVGLISRRRLLNMNRKKVILVDHNEISQAVDGIQKADILEIVDHHRLGGFETLEPVFFRNQPVGCTAPIVYQMYQENRVEIEPWIAGLLCSAIISDTLLFRSPTCTDVDKRAALHLAEIAGVEVESYAASMFAAGSNLKGKTDVEIFYQDFKKFSVGKVSFGVGQISSLNAGELEELKDRMLPYMAKAREEHGMDMMFFMLTNILTESTELLCEGQGAEQLIAGAFRTYSEEGAGVKDHVVSLPGVVSRKKQLIPGIMLAVQA